MILIKERTGWVPAVLTSYKDEKELQGLLAADGSLLDSSGAAAVREFPTAGGPIDVMYIDSLGVITVVECKLSANSDIKRKVIGQLIDYASALTRMTYEEFEQRFYQRTGTPLSDAVKIAAAEEAFDVEGWRAAVERNLHGGAFRLVIAVDQITEQLRRSVEYLNSHSHESVVFFAIELGYVKRDGVEILVTERFGDQAEDAGKGPAAAAKLRWTQGEVLDAAEKVADLRLRAMIEELIRHANTCGATIKGGQGSVESAGFYYPVLGKRPSLWSLWLTEDPQISLNFASLAKVSPEVAKSAHSELLKSISLAGILGGVDFGHVASKYQTVSLSALKEDPQAIKAIIAFLDTAVHTDPARSGPPPV